MENGKAYIPPVLTKRADKQPGYRIHCGVCNRPADGWTISDLNHETRPAALNVYCHGAGYREEITDMPSFRERMASCLPGSGGPALVVFNPIDTKPPYPTTDGTEL